MSMYGPEGGKRAIVMNKEIEEGRKVEKKSMQAR